MNPEYKLTLLHCFICRRKLQDHPLYFKAGTKWCPDHGDFFIQALNNKITPTIIFRPFIGPQTPLEPLRKYVKRGGQTPVASYARRGQGRISTILRCDQTGDIYIGMNDASFAILTTTHEIRKHLAGIRQDIRGFTFTRLDEYGDPI